VRRFGASGSSDFANADHFKQVQDSFIEHVDPEETFPSGEMWYVLGPRHLTFHTVFLSAHGSGSAATDRDLFPQVLGARYAKDDEREFMFRLAREVDKHQVMHPTEAEVDCMQDCVEVRQSTRAGGGLGVFASTAIAEGSVVTEVRK
jgi:hypothetical protein